MEPTERREAIEKIYLKECESLGSHLDRVFQYGFKAASATLITTELFSDFDIKKFSEEYIKNFIMSHINDGPSFASDHQPVLSILS